MNLHRLVLTSIALMLINGCTTNDQPSTTDDGLTLVEERKVDAAYIAPEADFSQYTRVNIASVDVSFQRNWLRDQNSTRRTTTGRVTQEDADRIKAALAQRFTEIFTEELEKGGYSVVAEVDPRGDNEDLLLLLPEITDLDVSAPDTMSASRSRSYTTSAGSMTLGMEFRDSITGDVLARIEDSRDAPDLGTVNLTSSVTNRAEADRMLRRWAKMLVATLDRAHAKSSSAGG